MSQKASNNSSLNQSRSSDKQPTLNDINDKLDDALNKLQTLDLIKLELENQRKELTVLRETVSQLKSDNEYLTKELLKVNLVISGIEDYETESYDDLFSEVVKTFKNICDEKVYIDKVYRLGKYRSDFCRAVKVRFCKMSDRDLIWSCRMQSKNPIFINEDLPASTRKAHAILRKKRNEAIKEGKTVKIDWTKKTIIINGKSLTVQNDELTDLTIIRNPKTIESTDSKQNKSSSSNTQRPKDRNNSDQNEVFLGKSKLRPRK